MSTTIPRQQTTATRMLDRCTVCGWPTNTVPGAVETLEHMAHKTPVCEDCGVCLDLWPCDSDCEAKR